MSLLKDLIADFLGEMAEKLAKLIRLTEMQEAAE